MDGISYLSDDVVYNIVIGTAACAWCVPKPYIPTSNVYTNRLHICIWTNLIHIRKLECGICRTGWGMQFIYNCQHNGTLWQFQNVNKFNYIYVLYLTTNSLRTLKASFRIYGYNKGLTYIVHMLAYNFTVPCRTTVVYKTLSLKIYFLVFAIVQVKLVDLVTFWSSHTDRQTDKHISFLR